MTQGDKKGSITTLRKWNLIAGGNDPKDDVIPASVGYGLEEGLQFAVSEITRLEAELERTKQERNAIAKNTREPLLLKLDAANIEIEEKRKDVVWLATEKAKLENYVMLLEAVGDEMHRTCDAISANKWAKTEESKP